MEAAVRSYMVRVLALFLGMPLGWVLCFGAVIALFWNEGRAVKTERTLQEGVANVVTITTTETNGAASGRLVHVQGQLTTDELLRDTEFEVPAKVLRLRRLVEVHQWRERKERRREPAAAGVQQQPKTTYVHDRVWSATAIDSRLFKEPVGHENPMLSLPFPCAEWEAQEFRLGGFTLQKAVRDEVRWFAPYGLQVGEAPPKVRQSGFRALTASFYRGDNPSFPQIGDMRVVYEAVPPTEVSIIAAQEGATLGVYRSQAGGTIAMVSTGRKSAQKMFDDAFWWNRLKTWLWRGGGFVALWWGYGLALRPFTTLAGILPGLFGGLVVAMGFWRRWSWRWQ